MIDYRHSVHCHVVCYSLPRTGTSTVVAITDGLYCISCIVTMDSMVFRGRVCPFRSSILYQHQIGMVSIIVRSGMYCTLFEYGSTQHTWWIEVISSSYQACMLGLSSIIDRARATCWTHMDRRYSSYVWWLKSISIIGRTRIAIPDLLRLRQIDM